MNIIGFAGHTFILREIVKEEVNHGNGHVTIITHNNFVKNIGRKIEKVMALYPNTPIDQSYNNRKSWRTYEEVWNSDDVFRYGKYRDTKISDCDDSRYISWYFTTTEGTHKDFIANLLKSRGYEIRYNNNNNEAYAVSPEVLNKEKENIAMASDMVEIFKTGNPFTVEFTKNLKENGEAFINGITYKFIYFKKMYYDELIFAFPLDSMMKSHRIKNRNVNITKYSYEINNNSVVVLIRDFEMVK